VICPSVCPLDQSKDLAALTAARSFSTPLAKEATRPDCALEPRLEIGQGFLADHGLEGTDGLSCFEEQQDTLLDGGNGDRLGLGKAIATDGSADKQGFGPMVPGVGCRH
jgi:hypothetical protein